MLHFLVSQCGALTEAETYSGYTAYQIAAAAAPVLAVLLADLGAQTRHIPVEKLSSDDEDMTADDDLSFVASWTPQKDTVRFGKAKLTLELNHLIDFFFFLPLQNMAALCESLHAVA